MKAQGLPPYDPDGDGDNDAQEALDLITGAHQLLKNARQALTGTDDQDDLNETTVYTAKVAMATAARALAKEPGPGPWKGGNWPKVIAAVNRRVAGGGR